MAQQPIVISIAINVLLFITNAFAASLFGRSVIHVRDGNPSCAPDGNFDLELFNLQLASGSSGKINQIFPSKLAGCNGWLSPDYFYTSTSGAHFRCTSNDTAFAI